MDTAAVSTATRPQHAFALSPTNNNHHQQLLYFTNFVTSCPNRQSLCSGQYGEATRGLIFQYVHIKVYLCLVFVKNLLIIEVESMSLSNRSVHVKARLRH